jgi:hypothetical protein
MKAYVFQATESAWEITERLNMGFGFLRCVLFSPV